LTGNNFCGSIFNQTDSRGWWIEKGPARFLVPSVVSAESVNNSQREIELLSPEKIHRGGLK
jgi:hypothetical protein